MVLAIGLVVAFLPQFNDITGKALSLYVDQNLLLTVLGITLMTGFIATIARRYTFAGFNPLAILKGGGAFGNSKYSLGRTLGPKRAGRFPVYDFYLIDYIPLLVIYQQMKFIQSKNLGYDKDNMITFAAEGKLAEDPGTFLNEIKNITGVVDASYMRGDLTRASQGALLHWNGKEKTPTTWWILN